MRLLVFAVTACLCASDAAAGAWTQAKGSGQLIMTTGRNIAPIGAFVGGTAD